MVIIIVKLNHLKTKLSQFINNNLNWEFHTLENFQFLIETKLIKSYDNQKQTI